jgi:hypothetical protein
MVAGCASLVAAACAGGAEPAAAPPTSAASTVASTLPTPTTVATTTSTIPGTDRDIATKDGWRYHIRISRGMAGPEAAAGECIKTAPPAKANVKFIVTVESLVTDRQAPMPSIFLLSNVRRSDGAVIPEATSFAYPDYSGLQPPEYDPDLARDCGVPAIGPDHQLLPTSGKLTLIATIGPVTDPAPAGLIVFGRYFDESGQRVEFSAPLT